MTQFFRLMRFSYCPRLMQTFTDTFPVTPSASLALRLKPALLFRLL
jgi:hypothetical protein